MKKIYQKYFLAVILLIAIVSNQVTAQKLNKDAIAFTKTYQDNYNKGNLPALLDMYTNEITMVYSDGATEKLPKSYFETDYNRDFGESAGTYFVFTPTMTETLPDGKIKISGSFDGYDYDRKTNKKLNPTVGAFENLIVKEGGKWKFAQIKNVYAMEQIFKDVRDLSLKFQDACNKEDAATIKTMYTANGVRIFADGKTTKGADSILAQYADAFKNSNTSTIVKLVNIVPQFDGSLIATGTFIIYGITTTGDRISSTGSYTNKLVKEDGQWKLAEVKQEGLVKAVVTHQVADFTQWKATFDAFRRARRDAGELTFEVSTLADDPKTVHVITEWASLEKAKEFFALPDLATNMVKAGVIGKPQIMYLVKK